MQAFFSQPRVLSVRRLFSALAFACALGACGGSTPKQSVFSDSLGGDLTASSKPAPPVELETGVVAVAPGYPVLLRLANGGEVVGALRNEPDKSEIGERGQVLLSEARESKPAQFGIVSPGDALREVLSILSRRIVTNHEGWIQTESGIPFARFHCQNLEVLSERDGRAQVRYTNGPFVFVGWVPLPLAPKGNVECGPRTSFQGVLSEAHGKAALPPEELPVGHRRIDGDVTGYRFFGDVYVRPDKGAPCQKWEFFRDADGLSLRRRLVKALGHGGLWETWESMTFDADPPTLHYALANTGGHWLQRPSHPVPEPSEPGATGAVWPFQVVRVLPDRVEWTETRFVSSYDPRDAKIWYRSPQACQAGKRSSAE